MERKTWVDSAFGLGRDLTPPQPKGMSGVEYRDLLCALSKKDQKERNRAGIVIALIALAGVIGLTATIWMMVAVAP